MQMSSSSTTHNVSRPNKPRHRSRVLKGGVTALIPIIREKRPDAKIIFRSHIQSGCTGQAVECRLLMHSSTVRPYRQAGHASTPDLELLVQLRQAGGPVPSPSRQVLRAGKCKGEHACLVYGPID